MDFKCESCHDSCDWMCFCCNVVTGNCLPNLNTKIDYKATYEQFADKEHKRDDFKVPLYQAPCGDCPYSCFWFTSMCIPLGCCISQYYLRQKVIKYDMTKYRCFQGHTVQCCCVKAGNCCEEKNPHCCLCLESFCCCYAAMNSSRIEMMEGYNLRFSACERRILKCNNITQCCCKFGCCCCDNFCAFSCTPGVKPFKSAGYALYFSVLGCMVSQTSIEADVQLTTPRLDVHGVPVVIEDPIFGAALDMAKGSVPAEDIVIEVEVKMVT